MNIQKEILRYMGHTGAADTQMEELISSCLEKLANVCDPRSTMVSLPCTIKDGSVIIDNLNIKSASLAACMKDCDGACLFAATLGAGVDRLINQRMKIDSAEALCLQACAAAKIEEYCDSVEKELPNHRPRFSPGYGDFDITHQTDILRMLDAQKIGLTETKTHMLTPLKSVTAVIGVGRES
jgi:hypothetical protein